MTRFGLDRYTAQDWQDLVSEWELQSNRYGEPFEEHASASLPVLEDLAMGPKRADAAVFGYKPDEETVTIAQMNSTFLPGYQGKVLRVRHIVFAPKFDLDDRLTIDDYIDALVGIFGGAILTSTHEMPSDHVKFHLNSPAERQFAEKFKEMLSQSEAFNDVSIRGAWIYLSKA